MKLRFVGAMALLAAFAIPSESQGAVFAAHLAMVDNGNGTFNLNYRLNEDANVGVTIRIKGPAPLNTVVRTITQGAQTKGAQSVAWDGKNDLNVAVVPGQYTWEVEASTNNAGATPYVRTGNGTETQTQFYAPMGVDTNNSTTSPLFGTVYVSSSDSTGGNFTTATGRPTPDGIYVLSNDLADHTGQGNTPITGGVAWVSATSASPFRCHVAPDDSLFITDWSDPHSGIWIMDTANPSAPFSELFAGQTRLSSGLTETGMHGSISSAYVEGVGAERTLYTIDEDVVDPVGTAGQTGSIWKYPIGTVSSNYSSSRTLEYNDAASSNAVVNFTAKLKRDPKSNASFWIAQYRATENATNPSLFHVTSNVIDWKSSVDFTGNINNLNSAAMDVSSDGNLIAVGGGGLFKVMDYTNPASPTILFSDNPSGNVKRDIAFDAADNILLSSNSSEDVKYYSKQGQNTFTTPNPVGSNIVIAGSGVNDWGLY